jgi:hypothetical protein
VWVQTAGVTEIYTNRHTKDAKLRETCMDRDADLITDFGGARYLHRDINLSLSPSFPPSLLHSLSPSLSPSLPPPSLLLFILPPSLTPLFPCSLHTHKRLLIQLTYFNPPPRPPLSHNVSSPTIHAYQSPASSIFPLCHTNRRKR